MCLLFTSKREIVSLLRIVKFLFFFSKEREGETSSRLLNQLSQSRFPLLSFFDFPFAQYIHAIIQRVQSVWKFWIGIITKNINRDGIDGDNFRRWLVLVSLSRKFRSNVYFVIFS